MADILNRADVKLGGTFSADGASIIFAAGGAGTNLTGSVDSGGAGLLTQNAQFNYSQQISRLYEVGSNYTFFIAGRTQGSLSMARVLGPRKIQTQFYKNYGNVCNAANNNITIKMATGCATGSGAGIGTLGAIAFNVNNCVIVSLGMSVGAQDMIINEQFQMMFVALELT